MPRKITKTVSKGPHIRGRRSRKDRYADLDLCKIDTSKFWDLSRKGIINAMYRVGAPGVVARSSRDSFRATFAKFLDAVQGRNAMREGAEVEAEANDGEAHASKFRRAAAKEEAKAREYERKIWELQQRAGCKLRGEEVVARDLEELERFDEAKAVRAQRRKFKNPKKR